MAADERWYFTKEQLANTPSRRCGYDVDKELSYRQQAANFIQDMGQKLLVTQLCINTAIVYMHRFYVFHSFTQFHRNAMAAASLFLAAKVEEQPRKLEHVIRVAQLCLTGPQQLDPKSEAYLEQAQDLVFNENVLLQTLGFDVAIDHPHTHVVRCCHLVRASKDLAQTSYFMASNSLHLTTMCLQYKPTVVACFCIHLACKWSNWEIPQSNEGKDWFWYVDKSVSLDQLEQLTAEFLVIFDKCPTKLKHKIKSISATQNTSVPPSVSGSPFDSEPRRVRPPGNEGSITSGSGSQDAPGSGLFRSSASTSSISAGAPQNISSGDSWMSQHMSSSSLPPLPRDQVSIPPQPPPPLPPPPPPPSASAGSYRDYREKKERERQEREKLAQSASVASSRAKGDMRRSTIKIDGHHHHHHHHHAVTSATTTSHHKPSSSGVPHGKPPSVPQTTSSGLLPQQAPPVPSSSRPPPGVTAARDAARREAAHARDVNRRRVDPYGPFDPPVNHWTHPPDDAASDPRHRDKERHSVQRLPPPPPPPLPPPPPPPPPQPAGRTKENPSQVTGGLPDLGLTIKPEPVDSGKHIKPDPYPIKVEADSKAHKVDSNSNSSYVHGVNIKQENSESKHGKDGYNSSSVSGGSTSTSSSTSNSSGSNSSSSSNNSSSSTRHRPRPTETFSEGTSRYDGRPKTATPPRIEASNGKGSHMPMLPPSTPVAQLAPTQSTRSSQQQSQMKKPSSPHHHHHHHHRARSPHPPSQSSASSMKPPSSGSNAPSKSSYYSSSKTSAVPETPTRNGTNQPEEVTSSVASSSSSSSSSSSNNSSSSRRNTLRQPSTPPRSEGETPTQSSPTNIKASNERKSSSSSRESSYGQRSKRQRTPPNAKKSESSSTQQAAPQLSLADIGTPPPPPPPPPAALLSPFGSPPATPSVTGTGAPATPGKSVSSGRSRLRTSSSSSEPELVPLVTKLDQIAGFQNIGNSMSIRLPDVTGRLPDTRVPELITPFRDTGASTTSGNGSAVSSSSRVSSSLNSEAASESTKLTSQSSSQPSSQSKQLSPQPSSQPPSQPQSAQPSSQASQPSSQPSSQSNSSSQQPTTDLGAVAFPSPATHAAVDPDDDGLFGSSSTVLDVVMSEQLPSLDRMLEPGGHLPTPDVSAVRKPGEHHHKSDKKKKKEKHRRKDKDKDKDKERDKDKEKSPHKVHKVKHKKEKHKEKLEGVSTTSGLVSTTSAGMPPTSAPIKITIPINKLKDKKSLEVSHSVTGTSTSTPSTGLKLKIQKDRLKVPEMPAPTSTTSSTPSGGLKIKISKDVISGATPSNSGSSTNKDSRKRDRTSPRGDPPPSKQPRVDGASSSSRRSGSSGSYNKQNGVPASSTSSTTAQSQQSTQRGSSYTVNKVSGRTDHPHHHSSHQARSRSSVSTAPTSQSAHHSHHQ